MRLKISVDNFTKLFSINKLDRLTLQKHFKTSLIYEKWAVT